MKRFFSFSLMLLLAIGAWADEYTVGETKTWVFGELSGTDEKSSVTAINSEYYVRASADLDRTFTLTNCNNIELTFADGTTTNTGTYYWEAKGSLSGTAPSKTLTAGSETVAGMPSFAFNTTVAGTVYVKIRQEGSGDAATFRIYFADGDNLNYVQYSGASRSTNTIIDEIAYTAPKGGSFFITSAASGAWGVYGVRFVPSSVIRDPISSEKLWTFDNKALVGTGTVSYIGEGLYMRGYVGNTGSIGGSNRAVGIISESKTFTLGEEITTSKAVCTYATAQAPTNSTLEASSYSTNAATPMLAFKTSVPGILSVAMSPKEDGNGGTRLYFGDGTTTPAENSNDRVTLTSANEVYTASMVSTKAGSFFLGASVACKIYAVRFVPETVSAPTIENHNGTITITAGTSSISSSVTTYYTTDGSDPTSSGTRSTYTTPFSQTTTATIRAASVSSGLTASSIASKSVPTIPTALSSTTLNFVGLETSAVTVDDGDNFNINTTEKTYAPKDADLSALYIKDVIFSYSRTGTTVTLGPNYTLFSGSALTITIPGLTAGNIVTLSSSSNNSSAVTFTCSSGGTIISGNTNSVRTTPTNIVVKSTGGNMVLTTASAGLRLYSITVTDGIVLTETNSLTPYSGVKNAEVKISFSRTFASGKASTVCLPFDMTAPAASVGTFASFTGVNQEMTEVTMTALAVGDALTAGIPYLFTPATDAEITFSNANYTVPAAGFTAASTVDQGSWHFKGTYDNLTWDDGQTVLYGLAGNAFNPTGGGAYEIGSFQRFNSGTTAAFRAYMYYGNSAPTHHAAPVLPTSMKVVLIGLNGNTTQIGTINVVYETNDWYTLDGRKLDGKPTRKGLYINGGRKVVIK